MASLVLNLYVESGREHMERVTQQRSPLLWRMLRLLLVTCIISSAQQGIAESTVDTSTEQNGKSTLQESEELAQRVGNAQKLAKLYYTPEAKNYKEPEKEAQEPVFVQVIRKIQLVLIGGILLIIGTFFIPSLLPQFAGRSKRPGRSPEPHITDAALRRTQDLVTMPEDKDGLLEFLSMVIIGFPSAG